MVDLPSAVWFPVVTLIVGAALKGLFDALTDRRALHREREARREQRLDAIRLRRTQFERETLLELQDVVLKLARHTGRGNYEDVVAHHKSGNWRKALLSDEVNKGSQEAQASLNRLRVRVRDEEIRRLAATFSETCAQVFMSSSKEAADEALARMSNQFIELQERVGDVLRSLDEYEDDIVEVPGRKHP